MTHRGPLVLLVALLFAALPLHAQQDDRINQLEKKLDELSRQMTALREELAALKGTPAATTPAPQQPAPGEEDLTKVDVVTQPAAASTTTAQQPPAPTAAGEQPQTALTDVQTVSNASNPGASKVFNPDISVIGNFIGKAGQRNLYEFAGDERAPASLDEAEVAFEAFVDPYAKAKFFVSVTPEGVDVEEGFAQFVTLPHDLTAKVGKEKATFGKANTWHTHVRPWVDQPLVIHNFFGDEGIADSGISVSKVFPNPFAYVEATGEVMSGNAGESTFVRGAHNDLLYNGHLKLFKDITENANVEVGTSFMRGALGNAGANQFGGVDLTYRWKPLSQGLYRSFIGRFEGIINDSPLTDRRRKGFYASADYQLAQRWFTGVRLDSADRFDAAASPFPVAFGTDRGASATLSFWPSEFSQLRGQLRRTKYAGSDRPVTELLFQLQFAIGAHGAHTF